jgi:hypothetical protein
MHSGPLTKDGPLNGPSFYGGGVSEIGPATISPVTVPYVDTVVIGEAGAALSVNVIAEAVQVTIVKVPLNTNPSVPNPVTVILVLGMNGAVGKVAYPIVAVVPDVVALVRV